MAITLNGVTCQEIARKDGLREEIDLVHGPSARKGFLCPWNQRFQAAKGLLGLTASTVGPSKTLLGQITLYLPAQYPEPIWNNVSNIYCTHVSIEPVGSPSQGTHQVAWPYAILWALYHPLPWYNPIYNQLDPTNQQVWATQKMSMSAEYTTIPSSGLKFSGGNTLTDQNYAFRMPLVEMEITFRACPYLPDAYVLNLVGTINKYTFLNVAAGSLMFNGVSSERTTNFDGTYTQDLTYSFTARMVRWDNAWDSKAGKWDQVQGATGTFNNTPIIASNDFSGQIDAGAVPIFPQYQNAGFD